MKRKVLIDTDPGHDDAMAIMLASLSGELDIVAITTVAGNSTIENTTRNARFIVGFLRQDIPVFSGAEKPLQRRLIQATVHGSSGLQGVEPENDSHLTGDAADKMIAAVTQCKGELTIIALGPLTNIANAILRDPASMSQVKQIIIMGGAFRLAGNQTPTAEFNMFVDPEAANIVLSSSIPVVLVPLDACNSIRLQVTDVDSIRSSRLRTLLTDMVVPYAKNLGKDIGIRAAIMYDPVAVFRALEPHSSQTVFARKIAVSTDVQFRGTLAVDIAASPTRLQVVTDIPADRFRARFIAAMNRFSH